jgi:hypothetical protein
MPTSIDAPETFRTGWVYVSLTVRDGERRIRPAQVCSDWILFNRPPFLKSSEIEIILVNGDEEQHQMAAVLPHEPNSTQIPIRLVLN